MACDCEDWWEVYETLSGWHWRRWTAMGRLVGVSLRAFAARGSCIRNASSHGMSQSFMPESTRAQSRIVAKCRQSPMTGCSACSSRGGRRRCQRIRGTMTFKNWHSLFDQQSPQKYGGCAGFSERGLPYSSSPDDEFPTMRQGYVYILASKRNGTLYIGVTSDLPRRLLEHQNNLIPGFTSRYSVKTLVWFEVHDLVTDAIIREKTIKKWPRQWKLDLIEAMNPDWEDISHFLM